MNYYNENNPYAAQWLRNLISNGYIPEGIVDERDIREVRPDDLSAYRQCHFFAGIGGWSLALQLAKWPADRPVWTGSCPCQPFSPAGKRKGVSDERHLWPVWFKLIHKCRPPVIFGEQVAAAIGYGWLDGVFFDLEDEDYACAASIIPACAANAPHRRERLWFVADSGRNGQKGRRHGIAGKHEPNYNGRKIPAVRAEDASHLERTNGSNCALANTARNNKWGDWESKASNQSQIQIGGLCDAGIVADAEYDGLLTGAIGSRATQKIFDKSTREIHSGKPSGDGSPGMLPDLWTGNFILCADGKARRIKPRIRLLADGVPSTVGRLRAYGNAIVPEAAARFIAAYMQCY